MAKSKTARMTSKRFRELVGQLGLSSKPKQAAALGVGHRAFIRYTRNQSPVPAYCRRLLLCLVHRDVDAAINSGEW